MNKQNENAPEPIIIAGAGIAGLSLALTLHQVGVPCQVFEAVRELRPLGVGINLQPNAVRELYDMGIESSDLDKIGLQTREYAVVGLDGKDIFAEPRGLLAGYHWPQYSVHRGGFQMLLYRLVIERLGPDAVHTDRSVAGYENHPDGSHVTVFLQSRSGETSQARGSLLIGADGLHSAVRAQMYPDQPPIRWGGAVLWRGTSKGVPLRTGASFIGLGTHEDRVILYPISQADKDSGLATINWIAEKTFDNSEGWGDGDWNKKVDLDRFIHYFSDWNYDWLDVPEMLSRASDIFEYPMVDRDPLPSWVDGNVMLIGDAAHVMYPTGSNGASQAIVDARVLGAALVEHGVSSKALQSVDDRLCDAIAEVVLRNRGAGPFRLVNLLYERCGGVYDDIDDVLPAAERAAVMREYKEAAGFAAETLNAAPATIPPGSKVAMDRPARPTASDPPCSEIGDPRAGAI